MASGNQSTMSALQGLVNNPHETRQPLIEGVFWSLLAVSSVFLALRLWTRAKYGKWQPDDYVLIFSWVSHINPRHAIRG